MKSLTKFRLAVALVIVGLVVSGVTAFPLLHELNLGSKILAGNDLNPANATGITHWVLKVREGLDHAHTHYPFLAYGTDWLAYAHLVIALFFVLPYREPVRYRGVLHVGVISCIGVVLLAIICGHVRGLPWGWRFIDSLFGVLCLPPLLYAIRLTHQIESASTQNA